MKEADARESKPRTLRVQFIHGLEGSPQGAKAQMFAAYFTALTPVMDTGDFEGCVRVQAATIASFKPDVLVGSSFGGAVAVALLQRGVWRGPTLLLAQAAQHFDLAPQLPEDVHVWLVHGQRDDVVAIEESRALAHSGTPGLVRLIEVDDDHSLHGMVESGQLIAVIRELFEAACRSGVV
jgi:alpha/beta superfamily hydrolase